MSARLACPLGGMGSSDLLLPPAKQRCRRQVCEKRSHGDQKRHVCIKRDLYASKETCWHQKRHECVKRDMNVSKRDMYASKETCMHQKRHVCIKRDMNASQETCMHHERHVRIKKDMHTRPTNYLYIYMCGSNMHIIYLYTHIYIYIYMYPQIPHTSPTQVHPRIPTYFSHIDKTYKCGPVVCRQVCHGIPPCVHGWVRFSRRYFDTHAHKHRHRHRHRHTCQWLDEYPMYCVLSNWHCTMHQYLSNLEEREKD